MPVTTGRKAIRFKSFDLMLKAIERDDEYQHRHLVIESLFQFGEPTTRRYVCDETGVPINAISSVTATLIGEGILKETGKLICPVTGRNSRGIKFNHKFSGEF